jgi:hypothetical protein
MVLVESLCLWAFFSPSTFLETQMLFFTNGEFIY